MKAVLLLLTLATALAAEPGWIEGSVFDADSLPWAGVTVIAGEQEFTTGSDGSFTIPLPTGRHELSFVAPDGRRWQAVAVPVGPDQTSEVLVTLGEDPTPRALIEAPELFEGPEVQVAAEPGRLSGLVVSGEDGRPVQSARVYVRGQALEASTDPTGAFQLELPPGTWDLSIVRSGFSSQTASAEVTSQGTTSLQIELLPAAAQMDEFAVLAPRIDGSTSALLDERKESSAVADVLGAEQMAASGDSDAASALARVSGLTVVGGRFVYVRGLGERYSATLLNGANLPSPEPERRVVPLDLFPTEMLDSVLIQKTFSPDMPAEFGGGVVRLRLKSFPDEPIAKIGVSGGFLTGSTFQKGPRGEAGPTDWLGVDGGHRALPEAVRAASDDQPLEEGDLFSDRGYTPEELEGLGESMNGRYGSDPAVVPPDLGLKGTFGWGSGEGDRAGGFLLGLNYKQGWNLDTFDRSYFLVGEANELERSHTYRFSGLQRTVKLGGILTGGVQLMPGQRIDATLLVTRKSDDEARRYSGHNRDVGQDIRVDRLRYVERMLITGQLRGHHRFEPLAGLTLDWRYTGSGAWRDEPDRRETRYDLEPGSDELWLLSDRPEGNQRVFSSLQDQAHDVGVDVSMPFAQWGGLDAKVQGGGGFLRKERGVDTRRFKFMHKGPRAGDDAILAQPADDVFTPETIAPDGFQFEEVTRQTDNYSAEQTIAYGYALLELPLVEQLSFLAGVRVEHSDQTVSTFELFNPDGEPVNASLVTTDVLPAVTVTGKLPHDMRLRGGYGMTLSRPDFRELSPATFNDVTGGRQTFGNPELERALIHNADLRWEWYPTPSESISVGAFYKHFDKPIETVVVVSAQLSVTWANALAADNVGVELDWRKNFGFVTPSLEDLYFAGNASFIWSKISLDAANSINTNQQRPLQGQSPWVVNAQLGYDNPDSGTRLSLIYNVFGRRIEEVGALGAPDTFEEPFHQLDFVGSQRLPAGFSLGLKLENILDAVTFNTRTVGDQVSERWSEGFEVGLSLSWEPTKARPRSK